jgi:hypothetical protein
VQRRAIVWLVVLGTAWPAAALAVCGDGIAVAPEECDDGGLCVGSNNAGAACTSPAQCPGGECKPFGGDGCAANCTGEADVPLYLGAGSLLQFNAFTTIGVSFAGAGSTVLTLGKNVAGVVPVVIKASNLLMHTQAGALCFCTRGFAAKTCGGTLLDADGTTPSTDCTADDSVCAGAKPCAFVHGPGNAASGVIGCDGLSGINPTVNRQCTDSTATDMVTVAFSGNGGAGSASILALLADLTSPTSCTAQDRFNKAFGPDGFFCTLDDPIPPRSGKVPLLVTPLVTGHATGQTTGVPPNGSIGPLSIDGAPFNCAALGDGLQGLTLASATGDCFTQALGPGVIFHKFVAGAVPSPTTTGTTTATATPSPTGIATATPTATAVAPTATLTLTPAPTVTATAPPPATATLAPPETSTPTAAATPSPTPPRVTGDANCDDRITAPDLTEEIRHIGSGGPAVCGADVDGSGQIEAADVDDTVPLLFR